MKFTLYYILLITILLLWSSCRNDLEFETSRVQLEFSKDTVYLDTIFTNIGSSTYNLKVYNRSNDDILIPFVGLSKGESSNYRLNVDGIAGKVFEDIELLANDSLFIFIETTVNINDVVASENQFLYTDAIEFNSGSIEQKVELVTLVKDAIFIYPQRFTDPGTGQLVRETLTFDVDGDGIDDDTIIEGRFLSDPELTFTNDLPYVIYGYAAVADGKTLTIEAGSRVHFHANSGLLVTSGGKLVVNGEFSDDQELLENEVIFEGDRLEPGFSDVPGQWGAIWLFNDSKENNINYATIKNSAIGLLVEGNQNNAIPKLRITNSQIYNASNFGILGRATSINAENLVINNCGQSSLAATVGGVYNFTHSTLANYWTNSFRQFPALLMNNYAIDDNDDIITNDLSANFNNCIIYGNDNPELILDEENGSEFDFKFTNCLIRFQDSNNIFTDDNYDFNNDQLYEACIFNEEPEFKNPLLNQMIIGNESAAVGLGNPSFASQVPLDILIKDRTSIPDLGAYQSIELED